MATRETRYGRGRRTARSLRARLLSEIRVARADASSQEAVARELGCTRSRYARFEADSLADVGLEDLCVSAAVLGMEVSVGLHPFEDAVRDVGQPRLGKWLARRLREHERDGGVDVILLVLSDSAINGRLLPNLLEVLGPAWRTAARDSAGIACRRAAAWFRRHPVVARAASQ